MGVVGVTVSIRKMSLGAGYRYLMSSVARGDVTGPAGTALTRYYAASGTPPGRFLGAGLAGLGDGVGVGPGTEVSEEHLFRMLGMLQDPVTGAPLGRAPRRAGSARMDGAGRTRAPARPVAGFDLTFSAPKSVSVAWALGDARTQAVVYEAHLRAVQQVISYAESAGIFSSRSGNAGVVHEEVRGVVAAGFDHWDSRAGDPQLHTHVVVMNRAQCADGTWRTLDGRVLFAGTVALSELYNGVLSDYLTQALGWGWEPVTRAQSAVPKYEVAGVSPALQTEFSRRSGAIEAAKDALVEAFVAAHGYQPSARQVLKLRQQATLATRPDKQQHVLAEQMDSWRSRAGAHLSGADPAGWVRALEDRNTLPLLTSTALDDATLGDVAAIAVRVVAGQRATFTRLNVLAEVTRQLHGARFSDPAERVTVIDRTTGMALGLVVSISAPQLAHTPALLRRQDGSSRFRFPHLETYTTQSTLDAEARLVDAGRCLQGPAVPAQVAAACASPESDLSAEQARVVGDVAGSGRVLDVLVGAAGTGKSTTMAGLRRVWEAHHGPGSVVGLAPSAAAAEVLSEAVGLPTENTVKWLTEHARNPERCEQIRALQAKLWRASPSLATRMRRDRLAALIGEYRAWSLAPGQLLIVDEASMAGTAELDALTAHAREAGAKVLLVGDPAQLSPVSAGGAFALLVHDRGREAPRLTQVHRFTRDWEPRRVPATARRGHRRRGRLHRRRPGHRRRAGGHARHPVRRVARRRRRRPAVADDRRRQHHRCRPEHPRPNRTPHRHQPRGVAPGGAGGRLHRHRRGPGGHPPQRPDPGHRAGVGQERRRLGRHRHRHLRRRHRPARRPWRGHHPARALRA
jgi:conjugative relaxase-like TrwC/TraI family protein